MTTTSTWQPEADLTICATCLVEHATPTEVCAICADERQWVPRAGQQWTTLADLTAQHHIEAQPLEPGLTGLQVVPSIGIGQRAIVVQHHQGNLLWDPTGHITTDVVRLVADLGGLRWVVASHPHMYGVQVEWARAFGAEVLVQAKDRAWVQRPDPCISIVDGDIVLADDMTLHRLGGHFPGASVLHLAPGRFGAGVLLAGDTIQPKPDGRSVAFMRSYPNNIPLSGAVVRRIADRALALDFDRLYGNLGSQMVDDAHRSVRESAERHIGWVDGDFDHLTD